MFRYPLSPDDPLYRRDRASEPPPTPAEMFRTLGLALVGVAFMVSVILSLTTVLIR